MILPTLYTFAIKLLYSLDIDKLSPDIWLLLPHKGQPGQNKRHFMPNPASNTILFL